MKRTESRFSVGVVLFCLAWQAGMRAHPAHAAENFDYPELSVTPRASERLEMEAKQELERRFTTFLPIQASALATFIAGVNQSGNLDPNKDPAGNSPTAGLVVGGAWLGLTAVLMFTDEPYSSAWRDVSGLPRKTVREQLTRERMAEQAIQRRARLGRTLKWLSVASNVFANGYMMGNGNDKAKAFDGIALVAALAPVIFPFHWQVVAEEQADYKKRIYAPVAEATLLREPGTMNYVPGFALTLKF